MAATYSNIADLASPDIDPEQWQDELEEDAANAASCIDETASALASRAEYFRRARMPAEVLGPLDEAVTHARAAAESMDRAVTAVGDWLLGLDLPAFDEAGAA